MASTDPTTMRSVLGHFPSGVTIVTGTVDGEPAGFTCQSFSSLSLDPPLVLILPGRSSTSWPRIEATGRFCVNVLAEDQQELSTTFAKSGTDKFAGVDFSHSDLGSPILTGATAWIDCTLHASHDGGDHLIVVGAVHDLDAPGLPPLVFHRGGYSRSVPS
ncbi:flavin reductase family protein [Actinomycetospora sp. TBRC 11914]|uniref:flavin reductase family protein n=1 Tax=Actinomycetospora sp. TBRC 11914 TaxID=2729387 RepID=UPI00145CEEC1|nr:flavin reductase family protein [Actinomycetospora sp. TBRC 11914]NMO89294.1 flavin reductase family protein [Actinomycetospora sp. TBRC 11914]